MANPSCDSVAPGKPIENTRKGCIRPLKVVAR
ncbi:Uncharacterised protein [Vibrio cholerae]|nr:Uncharacterised protein [Vibrio cholerae]CSI43570.1 Uncharacterised protein [Vibrio cholerae]